MKPDRRRARPALVLGLLLGLSGLATQAGASPATDLYSAATRTIGDEYFGWHPEKFSLLAGEYAQKLAEKCAPQGDRCDYATGRSVLGDLLDAFGDAHTYVRDPEGAERLREVTQDLAVQRTGIRTVRAEGGLLVVSVMPGSPADLAGVRRLDLLPEVAGQAAGKRGGQDAPVGPNDLIRLERLGQPVALTLRRAGQPDRALSLSTARLKARDVPTLTWTGPGGKTALIDYPTFLSSDSAALFLDRVREAQSGGATDLIVDLRYNGGGSLSQCVAAASVFGPVVYGTRFRVGGYTYTGVRGKVATYLDGTYAQTDERVWANPATAAILVGPNTASCAEVFSFFAQRTGVRVVGEVTKGVGNSGVLFHDLPDGGVLSVTELRAYDRDGVPLPDHITPDIVAPTDIAQLTATGADTALAAALTALGPVAPLAAPGTVPLPQASK